MKDMFSKNITAGSSFSGRGFKTKIDAVTQAMYDGHDGNFSRAMDSIAASMSDQIRHGPNSTEVEGQAYYTQTHIHINWSLLISKIGMVVPSLCFLLAAMIVPAEKSKAVWKLSSMAVLYHGIQPGHAIDHRSISNMGSAAANLWVSLEEDGDGVLRLVKR